jgi:hypothetical protein
MARRCKSSSSVIRSARLQRHTRVITIVI